MSNTAAATESPQLDTNSEYEVIIIGASAAGIRMGIVLRDLNAVALNTSPARTLQREHPSGMESRYDG